MYKIILATTMIVESLHMVEHVAQMIQKFVLSQPAFRGVLGDSLDIEPVHFVYNLLYLGLLLVLFVFRYNTRKQKKTDYWLITFMLGFQSWHFVEHIAKLGQHFTDGCISCPGILGFSFDLVILHFVYNLVTFIPLVVLIMMTQKDQLLHKEI